MKAGYDPAEISRVEQLCKKSGTSFVLKDGGAEGDGYAHFQFVGNHEGNKALFDTFLYTLEMEYFSAIYEDAQQSVITTHPQYKDADFDAVEGPHIDLMEETAIALTDDESYDVQEFLEVDEDGEFGISVDVCLNLEEVTPKEVAEFVDKFNKGTLKLDESFYSFNYEEDED